MSACVIGVNPDLCRGVECDDDLLGTLKVDGFRMRVERDEETVEDGDGCVDGMIIRNPKATATLTAKVSTADGPCGINGWTALSTFEDVFCTSLTVCNFVDCFGITTGGIYLSNIDINQQSNEFCEATLELFRYPGLL